MERKGRRRATVTLVGAILLAGVPEAALGVSPVDGGAIQISPVVINDGVGDQYDPHVSGNYVSYTDRTTIRLYDFVTGADIEIAGSEPDAAFQLSDVSGDRVAYSRIDFNTADIAIETYDITTGSSAIVDQEPGLLRSNPGLGGNTVAFVDGTAGVSSDIYAARLPGAPIRVTNDAGTDQRPQVAPSGDLVVFESCASSAIVCDIHQAAWDGSGWQVTALTATAEPEANPSTDGVFVVYEAARFGSRDIVWQPAGGGAEQTIDVAGDQRNPSVSAGLISFESVAPGETGADLYLYDIATNRLFRVTTTPADELLNDVDVLADGRVRLVWTSGTVGDRDVYGATIELPPGGPTYQFGGFAAPVDPLPTLNQLKAGAAVPVKFSLGGNQGMAIFAADYPKSQSIACDATAPVDGVEVTVSAGGSSLTYDPVTGLYAYVWKTDKAWAGTCRQLVLKFADGSIARANFKLK